MEESAATAALVGIVMALVEMVKKLVNKGDSPSGNNRNLEYKLEILDGQLRVLVQKFDALQKSFYDFREETRIRWARSGDDD